MPANNPRNITMIYNLTSIFRMANLAGLLQRDDNGYYVTIDNDNPDSCWIYSRYCFEPECAYWSAITSIVRKLRGTCFIPSRCMNCWKVNVIPQTIEQLFKLTNLQDDLPCKCGIDTRPLNKAMYGGYWYATSLDDAQGIYNSIKPLIGKMPITIKRGCAPIEQEYGDNWIQMDSDLEQSVLNNVSLVVINTTQSDETKDSIRNKWMRFKSKKVDNPVAFRDYSEESKACPV